MVHDDRHEDLLVELLSENADPRAALARSENAACTECGELLEDWMSTDSELQSAGQRVRETLDAAARAGAVPGEDLVEGLLGHRLGTAPTERAGPASGQRFGWVAIAFAAAAALALTFFLIGDTGSGGGDDGPGGALGPDDWALVEPIGSVSAFESFAWTGPDEHAGWFDVHVYAAGDLETPIASARDLTVREWVLSSDETADWPSRIRWEVQVYDASGAAGELLVGEASRTP